jgi:hypothetical protein
LHNSLLRRFAALVAANTIANRQHSAMAKQLRTDLTHVEALTFPSRRRQRVQCYAD